MYNNILVCVEPIHAEKHRRALSIGLSLAEDPTSDITALTVIEPIPGNFSESEIPQDLHIQAGERAMGQLRKFAGPTSEVHTVVLHGHAAREILNYAKERDIDCIVIASHTPGLTDYFLGSTASRVVRHAHCSVHVFR